MDPGRTTNPLTDSALDHEIEKTLSVDPSREFLARVRLRVANEPMRGAWGFTWKLAGAGIAVTAIVVVAVGVLWQGHQSPPTVPRAGLSHEPALVPRPGELALPEQPSSAAPARSRFVQRRAEPEVLISREESAALRQLFADISARRVDLSVFPNTVPAAVPLAPIDEIKIDPIRENPLISIGTE
jgi:hypothetical protein